MAGEEQKAHAREESNKGCNVALTGVLASLLAHKVLADEHVAVLVLIEAEHWHAMQLTVNETTGAHDVPEN